MRWIVCLGMLGTTLLFSGVQAQSSTDLKTADIHIVKGVDDFGQPIVKAVGRIANASANTAYTNINLTAAAFDANNTQIGTGIGVLDNACGVGLLPDFSLQPGLAQTFSAPLELTDPAATIDHVEISA